MSDLFGSGRIVDLVLALVALEAVALTAWRRRAGRPGLPGLLVNLASGACLMLALRAALVGAAWTWIALALAGAGIAHALDLRWRLREPGGDAGA
ncbi:conserved hypothetical protein [Methylobacterium sp. 4-46]|uniref:hypothetical protein n=1 Tax=unclassified Methylobacterium TaxID=2615210 RepID=UPI000152CCF8|nr:MULTISPECIES: hypothetical protein [Methylobacterium]ACA18090.1 conserved hypothetical protein [Methylobacterium sp. 4-46]WFT77389.1 hypothetical protein QA634_18820 [Methylobacterium nodulans]